MSAITIRLAQAADFSAIDAFDPFAGDRVREIADGRMLVTEVEGQVAGYASWLPAGFVGRDYISFISVAPTQRRRGLGRALLKAAETYIGSGRLFISTEENNTAMLTLLRQEEWTEAGAVAGANEDGQAEVFFYKDLP